MNETDQQPAVLIVDDDPGICKSLSRILKLDGYRVDIASSAAEAIDRDHWHEYFAILLDRKLPGNSMDDLLERIVQRAPNAAVIVITGYADLQSSLEAIRAGAADYLLKPVDPDHLRVQLRRFADLKQSRDEVRKRDEQVRFMIDHLPAGAAYVDHQTGEIRVNKHIENMTGYSASELTNRDAWFSALFGQKADQHRETYEQDSDAGFPEPRRISLSAKDDQKIVVEFSGYRYDEHEVWLLNDVTERQRYEEQLREQRDFSDRILETAQVIVLVLDPAARVVRFNKFMEELSGYSLEEVIDQNWFDVFIPESETTEIQHVFQRVVNGETVQGRINPIRTKDGELRQIAWWGKALENANGDVTAILSIGHDITALLDIQSQLVQSERLAAIGEMIAGLAHESRNALQRARACLDMLALDLADQPTQTDLTKRIEAALNELQRLYEEVRGYAAPVQLSLGQYDLKEIWKTSWQHLADAHSNRSVSLVEVNKNVDTACVVDQLRIEQVFRNILENAVAASSSDDSITLQTSECELTGKPAIRVEISDSGEGLKSADPEKIFEPFYTTKQKGTGLGMAITRRIVEAHHGTIRVSPNSSHGVTVELILPRNQTASV